jgi:hypothetical protein
MEALESGKIIMELHGNILKKAWPKELVADKEKR